MREEPKVSVGRNEDEGSWIVTVTQGKSRAVIEFSDDEEIAALIKNEKEYKCFGLGEEEGRGVHRELR